MSVCNLVDITGQNLIIVYPLSAVVRNKQKLLIWIWAVAVIGRYWGKKFVIIWIHDNWFWAVSFLFCEVFVIYLTTLFGWNNNQCNVNVNWKMCFTKYQTYLLLNFPKQKNFLNTCWSFFFLFFWNILLLTAKTNLYFSRICLL